MSSNIPMSTTIPVKERPILFSGPMVRAILSGQKSQTRRVAKDVKHPDWGNLYAPSVLAREPQHVIDRACPYGQPGDHLWVREAWSADAFEVSYKERSGEWIKYFGPDHKNASDLTRLYDRQRGQWRPSIHMPRWASRINLGVTGVRLERLQDISEVDAAAEGVNWRDCPRYQTPAQMERMHRGQGCSQNIDYIGGYRKLWESINGPESWAANPWVWVVEFRRI